MMNRYMHTGISNKKVPTKSSLSYPYHEETWHVVLKRRTEGQHDGSRSLGFSIVGGIDSPKGQMGIFIKTVHPKGLAAESCLIRKGDEILDVNGIPVIGMTRNSALQIFKNAKRSDVKMLMRRKVKRTSVDGYTVDRIEENIGENRNRNLYLQQENLLDDIATGTTVSSHLKACITQSGKHQRCISSTGQLENQSESPKCAEQSRYWVADSFATEKVWSRDLAEFELADFHDLLAIMNETEESRCSPEDKFHESQITVEDERPNHYSSKLQLQSEFERSSVDSGSPRSTEAIKPASLNQASSDLMNWSSQPNKADVCNEPTRLEHSIKSCFPVPPYTSVVRKVEVSDSLFGITDQLDSVSRLMGKRPPYRGLRSRSPGLLGEKNSSTLKNCDYRRCSPRLINVEMNDGGMRQFHPEPLPAIAQDEGHTFLDCFQFAKSNANSVEPQGSSSDNQDENAMAEVRAGLVKTRVQAFNSLSDNSALKVRCPMPKLQPKSVGHINESAASAQVLHRLDANSNKNTQKCTAQPSTEAVLIRNVEVNAPTRLATSGKEVGTWSTLASLNSRDSDKTSSMASTIFIQVSSACSSKSTVRGEPTDLHESDNSNDLLQEGNDRNEKSFGVPYKFTSAVAGDVSEQSKYEHPASSKGAKIYQARLNGPMMNQCSEKEHIACVGLPSPDDKSKKAVEIYYGQHMKRGNRVFMGSSTTCLELSPPEHDEHRNKSGRPTIAYISQHFALQHASVSDRANLPQNVDLVNYYRDYRFNAEPIDIVLPMVKTTLGVILRGGLGSPLGDLPLTIKEIIKKGPVGMDGRIRIGDQLVAINGTSVMFDTIQHARQLLRHALGMDVTLTIIPKSS
uniref:PDZ domain-containing protein n=1 Tax=Trichuris muris TaxID=70415 RepID=A0A5S6QAM4_TRIMR